MATKPLLEFATPALAFRKMTCLSFSTGSTAQTKRAPGRPAPGWVCRSRDGLRKRIAHRCLSKVLLGRVRLLSFTFRCIRRLLAPFSLSHEQVYGSQHLLGVPAGEGC